MEWSQGAVESGVEFFALDGGALAGLTGHLVHTLRGGRVDHLGPDAWGVRVAGLSVRLAAVDGRLAEAGRIAAAIRAEARNCSRCDGAFWEEIGGELDSIKVVPPSPLTSAVTSPKKKAP